MSPSSLLQILLGVAYYYAPPNLTFASTFYSVAL